MLDMYGKNMLLGALMVFVYSALFSIFSLFVDGSYYKAMFLLFSIVNCLIGIVLILAVYLKLYFLIRGILNKDVGLKKVLRKKFKEKVKKD